MFYRFYIFNINIYTYYIIALFISSNIYHYIPLSLTDTDGFHEMFRRANPTYQVPSSYKIKINLQELYKVGCLRLKDEISKCDCVNLTTDVWTSRSQLSFIITTITYLYNGNLHSYVLQTRSCYVSLHI